MFSSNSQQSPENSHTSPTDALSQTPSSSCPTARSSFAGDCYFSYRPSRSSFDETPISPFSPSRPVAAVPDHPLLADRTPAGGPQSTSQGPSPPASYNMSAAASQFLQLQTQAAHGYYRPQPQPKQRTSVDYSSESGRRRGTVEIMRCSRCTKAVETISQSGRRISNDDAAASGMVRFGYNLYYCGSCAKMVGYI